MIDNRLRKAAELRVAYWIDGAGVECPPLQLSDLTGEYKILYCFQAWCAGCHSEGFPTLKKLVDGLDHQKFSFAVIQTVFEGEDENTPDRLVEMQDKYDLRIPFGHDQLEDDSPTIMQDYATGGTPWFIVIDPKGDIAFSDFRLNADALLNSFNRKTDADHGAAS